VTYRRCSNQRKQAKPSLDCVASGRVAAIITGDSFSPCIFQVWRNFVSIQY